MRRRRVVDQQKRPGVRSVGVRLIDVVKGLCCPFGGDSSVGKVDLNAGAAEVDDRDQGVG
jgi:hypothetical protein